MVSFVSFPFPAGGRGEEERCGNMSGYHHCLLTPLGFVGASAKTRRCGSSAK